MSTRRDHLQWALRRQRGDAARVHTPPVRQVFKKLLNIARRLTVFISRPYMRRFARQTLPDLQSVQTILIIPHDPIGDLLLSEPIWRKLKQEKPSLRLGIAVSPRNKSLSTTLTGIDEHYDFYGGSLSARWREISRARKALYDVVLVPVGFYKPTRFAFIARFVAGRRGFTATMHHSRAKRYSDFYSYCTERPWRPVPQPMVEQYQALIERVFGLRYTDDERTPRMSLANDLRESAKRLVTKVRQETAAKYVLLVHLEAKVEPREWGIQNVERLHNTLPDCALLLTASPIYWEKYGATFRPSERMRRIDTEGIIDAAALVAEVDLLLSPDTSIVHFAAAEGTPIVAFYPYRDEWLPYRATTVILTPQHAEPISTISVAEVRNAIYQLLRG
jgi:ADP-heptose:LPS heptosyltransferase